MSINDLKAEISDEVSIILAGDFQIDVTKTMTVPHASDGSITFPNLDEKKQATKLIDTCVLFIDIRRSTQLNFEHKPQTVAKLYSAFVRAMTRCAQHHNGHVRGIIGDRVMVIFDRQDAFTNAVECAISMNSASQYVINKYFVRSQVECGIGIDAGRMLATKTGIRKRGFELGSYRNLVWLGRPANVASKLTDLANKPAETVEATVVNTAHSPGLLSIGLPHNWIWRKVFSWDFVRQLAFDSGTGRFKHTAATPEAMFVSAETIEIAPETSPILMTEAVWRGYKTANPNSASVVNGWFKEFNIRIPGYTGKVFGGDVHYKAFENQT